MPMGSEVKVFATYDRAFWRDLLAERTGWCGLPAHTRGIG